MIVIHGVMPDFMSGIHDLKITLLTKSWMAEINSAMTQHGLVIVNISINAFFRLSPLTPESRNGHIPRPA